MVGAPRQLNAKAEWYNPGGSVKDRAARRMILEGIRGVGRAHSPASVLLDATSGNTGIAYAMTRPRRWAFRSRCPCPSRRQPRNDKRITSRRMAPSSCYTNPMGRLRWRHRRRPGSRYAADPDSVFLSGPVQQRLPTRSAHFETTGPGDPGRPPPGRSRTSCQALGTERHLHGHRSLPARQRAPGVTFSVTEGESHRCMASKA